VEGDHEARESVRGFYRPTAGAAVRSERAIAARDRPRPYSSRRRCARQRYGSLGLRHGLQSAATSLLTTSCRFETPAASAFAQHRRALGAGDIGSAGAIDHGERPSAGRSSIGRLADNWPIVSVGQHGVRAAGVRVASWRFFLTQAPQAHANGVCSGSADAVLLADPAGHIKASASPSGSRTALPTVRAKTRPGPSSRRSLRDLPVAALQTALAALDGRRGSGARHALIGGPTRAHPAVRGFAGLDRAGRVVYRVRVGRQASTARSNRRGLHAGGYHDAALPAAGQPRTLSAPPPVVALLWCALVIGALVVSDATPSDASRCWRFSRCVSGLPVSAQGER